MSMVIEYLAALGAFQVKSGARFVVEPGAAIPSDMPLLEAVATALWAVPETLATTPHRKLTFMDMNCLVRVDGRQLPPVDANGEPLDLSGESPEVQAFHSAIYGYNSGEYAARYALLNTLPVQPAPNPMTPQSAAALKLRAITNEREALLLAGMTYPFPVSGGTQDDVIQTRPADQIKLLIFRDKARQAQAAGVMDPALEFRAQSDTSYWLTPAQALEMCDALDTWGYQEHKTSWARKEQVKVILADEGLSDAEKLVKIASV